jgi:stage III sporulation protein AF
MSEWITRVLALACISILTELLLPKGNTRKMAMLVTSLAMMVVLVKPLGDLVKKGDWSLPAEAVYTRQDTGQAEEKIRRDILQILSSYQGYSEAEVTVVISGVKLSEVVITLPHNAASMDHYINRDDTLRAVISAFYRIDSDKISINR